MQASAARCWVPHPAPLDTGARPQGARPRRRTESGMKNSQMQRKPEDNCDRPSGSACCEIRMQVLIAS